MTRHTTHSLLKRIDTLLAAIDQQQEDMPDIHDRISAWTHEGITRKFAIFQIAGLTSEQRSLLCSEVEQDIAARKTPAEQRAEQQFYKRYPVKGAKDELLRRLGQIREAVAG